MFRGRTSLALVLLAVLVPSTLASCGDDGPDRSMGASHTASTVVVVHIQQSRFSEPTLQIAPGTTVRFVNDDGYAHTVTSFDDGPVAFDSGELGPGDTFELTFTGAGTSRYFCRIHPTMRAEVVVA